MSGEIERFHLVDHWGEPAVENVDASGQWVDYDDHAAALSEKDARIAELEGLLREPLRIARFFKENPTRFPQQGGVFIELDRDWLREVMDSPLAALPPQEEASE